MSKTATALAPIKDQTLITRSTALKVAPLQDELVMMHVETSRYYNLDEIASDIWRRLECPRTFGDLVNLLVADYDAERAVIAEDVRKLLSIMAEHQVVTLT